MTKAELLAALADTDDASDVVIGFIADDVMAWLEVAQVDIVTDPDGTDPPEAIVLVIGQPVSIALKIGQPIQPNEPNPN